MENIKELIKAFDDYISEGCLRCGVKYGYEYCENSCLTHKMKHASKLMRELDFTRQYIHDQGLEWDLLSKFQRAENEFEKTIK
jgi:hypothetical protein